MAPPRWLLLLLSPLLLLLSCVLAIEPIPQAADILTAVNVNSKKVSLSLVRLSSINLMACHCTSQ